MIAQWENERVSLSVLSVALVMIAQWENERVSLFVLSVAQILFLAEHFRHAFLLTDHTLPARSEPAWQKMAQSPLIGTIKPVDIEEEGRSPTMDRQWVNKNTDQTNPHDLAIPVLL